MQNKLPWIYEPIKLINGVSYIVEVNSCLSDGVYHCILEWSDDCFLNTSNEPFGRFWNRALPLSFLEDN